MNRHFIGPLTPAQARKRMASRQTFAEFRQFTDAYDATFKEWLIAKKTAWYRRALGR